MQAAGSIVGFEYCRHIVKNHSSSITHSDGPSRPRPLRGRSAIPAALYNMYGMFSGPDKNILLETSFTIIETKTRLHMDGLPRSHQASVIPGVCQAVYASSAMVAADLAKQCR